MAEWFRKTAQEVLKELKVEQNKGLTNNEVAERLKSFGPNMLESGKKINPFKLFLSQFNDVLIIVLLIAAAVSYGVSFLEDNGSVTESLLIFGIVLAIAVIGFFNEYKAEKTVEALKKLVGHSARVRREGKELEIPATELVPGDIVIIDEGKKVPADIRLIQVKALQVNEASLTGESLPISKNVHTLEQAGSLGDQKNVLFSGTIVTTGTAEGVVVATGGKTEIGKIAHMVAEVEEEQTPMQKKLDDLGRKMGALILLICIAVFIIIFFMYDDGHHSALLHRLIFAFTVAVALAVAAIPEGLSFVVRISLALGARRMAAKNALVRRLSAVEALGSTDVICTDKTGTLTRGEMTVRKLLAGGEVYELSGTGYDLEGEFSLRGKKIEDLSHVEMLLRVGALCNNSRVQEGSILGDPTEGALLVSAHKAGLTQEDLQNDYPRVDEIPFSSERKMMTTLHRLDRGYLVASKGAADVLLHSCTHILEGKKVVKLTEQHKKEVIKQNVAMSSAALRVLGFAYKQIDAKSRDDKETESKLVFIGLQAMMDPPRTEVKDVMHRVQVEAGMRVIMITGDYIETAKAIAKEIGIEGKAISGAELDEMTQEEFEDKVEKISVYARVNPEHKIRIVQALKKHGHQVAMTGDGVNDAPAIKAADIGIAMGITGTDASKEAADLILLDDKFVTIIGAIEEGRGIFDNVRKFVSYLLGANIAEVFIVVGGILFLKDPVFTATQLLFVNIVTDGLPAVALGSDPAEKGIMRYKPFHFQGAIINKKVWIELFAYASLMTALLLSHFAYVHNHTSFIAGASVALTALVVYELVRLIVLRTNYHIPWFSNPWLSVALVSSFFIQVFILYNEGLARLFEVEKVSIENWLIIACGAGVVFVFMKIIRRVLNVLLPDVKEPKSALSKA